MGSPNVPFNSSEIALFWRYISSSLDRLVDLANVMPPAGLNWQPPATNTNSVAALTAHTLANAEENLLGTLCGATIQRSHAAEFTYVATDARDLLHRWHTLRAQLSDALAALPADTLSIPLAHPRRGTITGRDILIVVARHAAEHLGQAELTRDLWLAQGAPPPNAAPATL